MILDLTERTLVSLFEPIPWDAKVSAADMGAMILARLPKNPTRADIITTFGPMKQAQDTLYWNRDLKPRWWDLLAPHPYWHMLFYLDPGTDTLQRLEVQCLSGK